jgi:hypothetical protein
MGHHLAPDMTGYYQADGLEGAEQLRARCAASYPANTRESSGWRVM